MAAASLDGLAAGLLLLIAKRNELSIHDLAHLASTNRKLYNVCNEVLYRRTGHDERLNAFPVIYAAWKGELGTLVKALDGGSSVDSVLKSHFHRPSLNWERGRLWGRGRPGDRHNSSCMTFGSIHVAAANGHVDILERLLDERISMLNMPSEFYCNCSGPGAGGSCFCETCETCDEDPWYWNEVIDGSHAATPLHVVVCYQQWKAVEFLIQKGADILTPAHERTPDYCRGSPLFLAARLGRADVLRIIFERENNPSTRQHPGIDLAHVEDEAGRDVLYHACNGNEKAWESTVPFLLRNNPMADIHKSLTNNTQYSCGQRLRTPLQLAIEKLMDLRIAHGWTGHGPSESWLQGNPFESMLARQPITGNEDAQEHLYLHYAIAQLRLGRRRRRAGVLVPESFVWMVNCLLKAGADPSRTNCQGQTPIVELLTMLVGKRSLLSCYVPKLSPRDATHLACVATLLSRCPDGARVDLSQECPFIQGEPMTGIDCLDLIIKQNEEKKGPFDDEAIECLRSLKHKPTKTLQ
ncbi:hypothetical protein V8F33_012912 [Rhypophila sp. PSN 637]